MIFRISRQSTQSTAGAISPLRTLSTLIVAAVIAGCGSNPVPQQQTSVAKAQETTARIQSISDNQNLSDSAKQQGIERLQAESGQANQTDDTSARIQAINDDFRLSSEEKQAEISRLQSQSSQR